MTRHSLARLVVMATALALVTAVVLGAGGARSEVAARSEAGDPGAGASHSTALGLLAVVTLGLIVAGTAALGALGSGRRRSGPET